MSSLYFDIVILVISHFGFEDWTLVLIALSDLVQLFWVCEVDLVKIFSTYSTINYFGCVKWIVKILSTYCSSFVLVGVCS